MPGDPEVSVIVGAYSREKYLLNAVARCSHRRSPATDSRSS